MSSPINFEKDFTTAMNYIKIREFRQISQEDMVKFLRSAMPDNDSIKQNVSTWENLKGNPGPKFITHLSKILDVPMNVFYEKDLTKEYLEKHFPNGNSTHEHNQGDNKQKQLMNPRETFYQDLIENNDEYSILPRAVLKDYKIVPDKIIDVIIQSNDNEKKALIEGLNSKYELIIQGYKNKVADLEAEINRLRGG